MANYVILWISFLTSTLIQSSLTLFAFFFLSFFPYLILYIEFFACYTEDQFYEVAKSFFILSLFNF
jgi:hypothetical protein